MSIPCCDFTVFKQSLANLRKIDDFVVQNLNTNIPTDTFKNQDAIEKKHIQCGTLKEK
eukprot:Pgem_evm1s13935